MEGVTVLISKVVPSSKQRVSLAETSMRGWGLIQMVMVVSIPSSQ
jgi:hypothetical protein